MSGESTNVSTASTDVPLPSSGQESSSGHIETTQPTALESIVKSTLPIVKSTPYTLPNTHPMLTRSKHGIFKPKAYAIMRDYFQLEPPNVVRTYVIQC